MTVGMVVARLSEDSGNGALKLADIATATSSASVGSLGILRPLRLDKAGSAKQITMCAGRGVVQDQQDVAYKACQKTIHCLEAATRSGRVQRWGQVVVT